ncbi:hypothetical protein H6G81_34210 [Scytonema hofmannii FACHB-248]|uniref:Uncharacterized protein n=1 Tax=Scytonema hofmannii FACHB-248 TaxID=1842502 RepID=A0ABR8H2D6_9CYAN|nr:MULTISPECIES: hypothetical protein [Nostocales]MBD2609411.1 hypothetical protein [Scytonema hofmannii FACHB-248]
MTEIRGTVRKSCCCWVGDRIRTKPGRAIACGQARKVAIVYTSEEIARSRTRVPKVSHVQIFPRLYLLRISYV